MHATTVVAILFLAAEVALSVALPLPSYMYASLSCCICDAQILSFFADLTVPVLVRAVGAQTKDRDVQRCLGRAVCSYINKE